MNTHCLRILLFVLAISHMSLGIAADSAGAFLYFKNNEKTWVLLGHDGDYGNWSDFGGDKKDEDKNLMKTALRELREETRFVYGDMINVELGEPYLAGKTENYLQFFIEVPFVPVSILNKSSPSKLSSEETEVNAYTWIPLNILFDIVKNKPNENDYRYIELPKKYIPIGTVLYGKSRSVKPYLRVELAETIDLLRKTKHSAKIYTKAISNHVTR